MKQLSFEDAFKYPFKRWIGMLNILWLLIPVIGLLVLIGYRVRILNEFMKGKVSKLPKIDFWNDFVLGTIIVLKGIPLSISILIIFKISTLIDPLMGRVLNILIGIFIVPIIGLNFVKKQTIASSFEIDKIKTVFKNLENYIIALLKEIALTAIFLIMTIILVGIPAGVFTKNVFIAEFYKKFVK